MRRNRERHRDHEPGDDRDRDDLQVAEERVRRSGRSCRRPSRSRRSRCRPRTPTGSGGGRSSTAARGRSLAGRVCHRRDMKGELVHPVTARSAAGVLLRQRLIGGEELRDDLDREDAGNPPLGVHDGRVAGLGLEQVGEGVAHHVVELDHGLGARIGARRDGLAEQVVVGQPAERPALGVDDQRVGHLRSVELRPHLGGRLADVRERRLPEVDVARRASAPAASGRGRRPRSPRRSRPLGPSGAPPEWRTGPGPPPSRRIAIRSPILIASSMSWVTKRIVLRTSAWRRRNSFWSCSRLIGSTAPNGSSISITPGLAASARATPTRCCWPPESCAG